MSTEAENRRQHVRCALRAAQDAYDNRNYEQVLAQLELLFLLVNLDRKQEELDRGR